MLQKIKILLFMITVAGCSLTAYAGYLDDDHGKGGWHSNDQHGHDWFADFHGKGKQGDFEVGDFFSGHFNDKKDWDFHGKSFGFDPKWWHTDNRWRFDWKDWFDGIFPGHHPKVPEPASMVLLATGILLIAGVRRIR
jgi:hypothetical protein